MTGRRAPLRRVLALGAMTVAAGLLLTACNEPNNVTIVRLVQSASQANLQAAFIVAADYGAPSGVSVASGGSAVCTLVKPVVVIRPVVKWTGGPGTCTLTVTSDTVNEQTPFGAQAHAGQTATFVQQVPAPIEAMTSTPVTASTATPDASPAETPTDAATPTASETATNTPAPARPSATAAAAQQATPSASPIATPGRTSTPTHETPKPQIVTWSPATTISSLTPSAEGGKEFTPSAWATTSGDGSIAYRIADPGKSYCHMGRDNSIVVGANGTCSVIASAAATPDYAAGSTTVTFTITGFDGAVDTGGGSGANESYSCPPGSHAEWSGSRWICVLDGP